MFGPLWRRIQALALLVFCIGGLALTGQGTTEPAGEHKNVYVAVPVKGGLATGGFDRTVRLWEIKNGGGTQLHILNDTFSDTDVVLSIAADPAGQYLVSGGRNGKVNVWLRTDGALQKIAASDKFVAAARDEAGTKVAFATEAEVRIWNPDKPNESIQVGDTKTAKALALLQPGAALTLFVGYESKIEVIDQAASPTPPPRKSVSLPPNAVGALAVAEKKSELVMVGTNGVVRRARIPEAEAVKEIEVRDQLRTAVSSDGSHFATVLSSMKSQIELWDVNKREKVKTINAESEVVALAVSQGGSKVGFLVKDNAKNTVRIWDKATPEEVKVVPGVIEKHDTAKHLAIQVVKPEKDGKDVTYFAAATTTDKGTLVSIRTHGNGVAPSYQLETHQNVNQLALTPDGKSVLIAAKDDNRVLKLAIGNGTHQYLEQPANAQKISRLAVTGDRSFLVVAGTQGNGVHVWKNADTYLAQLGAGATVDAVAVTGRSGDEGLRLAWFEKPDKGPGCTVRFWQINDVKDSKLNHELQQLSRAAVLADTDPLALGRASDPKAVALVFKEGDKLFRWEPDVREAIGEAVEERAEKKNGKTQLVLASTGSGLLTIPKEGKLPTYRPLPSGEPKDLPLPGLAADEVVKCGLILQDRIVAGTAVGETEGKLRFWPLANLNDATSEPAGKPIHAIGHHPHAEAGKVKLIVQFTDGTFNRFTLAGKPDGLPLGVVSDKKPETTFLSGLQGQSTFLAGSPKGLALWQHVTARKLDPLSTAQGPVYDIAWRPDKPDKDEFLTGGGDGSVRLWRYTGTWQGEKPVNVSPGRPIYGVAYLPAKDSNAPSRFLAAGKDTNLYFCVEGEDPKKIDADTRTHQGAIFALAVYPRSDKSAFIATGSSDRLVKVRSYNKDGTFSAPVDVPEKLGPQNDAIAAVAFTPSTGDSARLASLDFSGVIKVYTVTIEDMKPKVTPLDKTFTLPKTKNPGRSILWENENNLLVPAGDNVYRCKLNN